ncbi:deoxyribodipyrimidine photo-lyase [Gordonia rhizosphera NBRC 16068]|uniref:Deoxyribodipyrimidine photo-lyase n=1 Tax=Gordonia rhizosphera NBRC 16068 TaxID=1108045 RepID=K6X2Z7_9ACTN|nr:deoxyribodipyrimidine photo-lyase [Gordonia rhizosphera NBRC 16068]
MLVCFVADPRLERSSGPRRLSFLYESLRELDEKLAGRLLVVRGRPESEIPRLANAADAVSVHVSADFSPFGRLRDAEVAAALGDIPLRATGSPYLVSPGRITKGDGEPYRVFTPFFRRWREHGWRAPASSTLSTADLVDPTDLRRSGRIRVPAARAKVPIRAGEDAARQRWAEFVGDGLDKYATDRDRPDRDGSSRMSAYLKFGNIHPRTMAADLDGSPGAQAYLRELAFRDFYAHVLHHWPDSLWHNWNRQFDDIELDTDDAARRRFEAWKTGRTGFPIVDAGMRQLAETGFMHNRVRMITASFLVKDLHLPWWWGARWFLDQLVDGDVASNQHGWQWAAGTGTDAAPYFRVFNPTAQAEKFDPDGSYVRRWVPEIDTDAYPAPIIDHKTEREEALRRYRAL